MNCPTITTLHAILAAYDAPAGPSKADTLKAVAECLSGACAPVATRYIGSEANAELIERGAVLCAVTAKPISRDDVPLYSQPVAAQVEHDVQLLIAAESYILALDAWDNSNKAERKVKATEAVLRAAILAAKGGAQ